MQQTATLNMIDALRELACQLDAAPHGTKGEIKEQFCDLYDWSMNKLHLELKKIGWDSGRKRRCDAGTTSQNEDDLIKLGAVLRLGVRKNKKATMEIPNAMSMLAENGAEFSVSPGRAAELLRQRNLDAKSQAQATPHISLRSLYPNHVHLVDPSLCLLYYSPDGKQHIIRDDEAYKNKPEFIERVGELKCWRYVLVDHFSNTVIVRYYQAKGETQANLFDFLLYCWQKLDARPFHGVPTLMVWDKGSANTSSAIKNALRLMNVDTYEHMAGNPRAKGAVEEANNRVEKLFESRLRFEPVNSVAELNQAVEAWTNAYNANAIPHYDARLKRRGMLKPLARYEIWQRIRTDQLRVLPPVEVCRWLLSAEPKPRKVRADMTITFVHPVAKESLSYDLRGIPNVYPRQSVLVSPLVMGDLPRVIVTVEDYTGEAIEHVLEPIAFDGFSGQRLDSPVWGEEFRAQQDTNVETAGKTADQAAYPNKTAEQIAKAKGKETPFGGLDAHTHLGDVFVPDYMDKRGTELDVPNRSRVEVKPLSHIQACRALVGNLGRSLSAEENAWIRSTFPSGIPEEELPALATRLRDRNAAQTGGPGLAIVN